VSEDPFKRSIEENEAEYQTNMHAIQSCIALGMNRPEATGYGDPKHMQVGIVSSFVTHHAIAEILIRKKLFDREEYIAQMVLSTRQELQRLTIEAQERLGSSAIEFH